VLLPTKTFEADRFTSTVAPAIAANEDGGTGTQTSSQISTWKRSSGRFSTSNTWFAPKGIISPNSSTQSTFALSAFENWRDS
jgi:hypothetical protein